MENIKRAGGRGKRAEPGPGRGPLRGGFTLVEVMFASTVSLLLFLVLLESLTVCQRMAANIKWRLAADAIAYDTAWKIFNEQTEWFETRFNAEGQATWEAVPVETSSVWYGGQAASVYWSVTPVGMPTGKWSIRTNVQWPVPGGRSERLPADYVIERCRAERNQFRGLN